MRHDSRPPGRPQRADATGLVSTRWPADEVDRIVRETRAATVRTHLTHHGMFLG